LALGGAHEKVWGADDRGEASVAAPGKVEPVLTTWAAARLGGGRPAVTGALGSGTRTDQRSKVASDLLKESTFVFVIFMNLTGNVTMSITSF
jgi:hypothetical protein